MSMRLAATRTRVRQAGHMPSFAVTAWDEIEAFYEDLIDNHAFTFVDPMLQLVRSVIAEGQPTRSRLTHRTTI